MTTEGSIAGPDFTTLPFSTTTPSGPQCAAVTTVLESTALSALANVDVSEPPVNVTPATPSDEFFKNSRRFALIFSLIARSLFHIFGVTLKINCQRTNLFICH